MFPNDAESGGDACNGFEEEEEEDDDDDDDAS